RQRIDYELPHRLRPALACAKQRTAELRKRVIRSVSDNPSDGRSHGDFLGGLCSLSFVAVLVRIYLYPGSYRRQGLAIEIFLKVEWAAARQPVFFRELRESLFGAGDRIAGPDMLAQHPARGEEWRQRSQMIL